VVAVSELRQDSELHVAETLHELWNTARLARDLSSSAIDISTGEVQQVLRCHATIRQLLPDVRNLTPTNRSIHPGFFMEPALENGIIHAL
jgi:hypothetical protein